MHKNIYLRTRGVRGRMVRVVDFESLAAHCCGFESRQGLWILSFDEANHLAYGTSMVILIMHGGHLSSFPTSKAGKSPYKLKAPNPHIVA